MPLNVWEQSTCEPGLWLPVEGEKSRTTVRAHPPLFEIVIISATVELVLELLITIPP